MEPGDTAAWEKLRGTRWSPPPAASGDPARRRTYVFALEQAEQMFRAAITVGVGTRPLQVFYGLNQAGRAIAAAAPALTGDAWELAGHGIRCDAATLRGPLPGIRLAAGKPGGRASFVRLSELLGSSSWDGADPVTLSDVWDCLPGNRLHPLCDCGESRTTPLYVDQRSLFDEAHPLINVPVAHFPAWVVNSPDGRKVLAAYLTRFPDVRPWHSFYSGEDAAPAFTVDADGWGELVMNWAHPDGRSGTPDEHLGYLQSMTRAYRGERWLFPRRGRHGQEHASADGLVGGTVHAVDAGSLSAG